MKDKSESIRFGILAGLIYVLINLMLYLISPRYVLETKVLLIYILVIITTTYLSIRTIKKKNNNQIGFKEAFVLGLISISILVIVANIFSYMLFTVIDPSLSDLSKEIQVEQVITWFGETLPESQLEEIVYEIENESTSDEFGMFVGILFGLSIGIFFDFIISLGMKTPLVVSR